MNVLVDPLQALERILGIAHTRSLDVGKVARLFVKTLLFFLYHGVPCEFQTPKIQEPELQESEASRFLKAREEQRSHARA